MDELKKSKIKFEAGKLHVGDFAWVTFDILYLLNYINNIKKSFLQI